MTIRQTTLCIALLAGLALATAGCDQRQTAETAGRKLDRAAETAGQKLDRATDQAADAGKEAAAKAAAVVDDAAITAKVKAALFAEPGLKTLQVDVETKNAVVTLAGSVDSEDLHKRAVQVASAMSGVQQVVDKLVVKS